MFSYKSSLPKNWNHSIMMCDGQVMAKTQSWQLNTAQENCLNLAPFECIYESKGVRNWIDLFKGDMFSSKSSLASN